MPEFQMIGEQYVGEGSSLLKRKLNVILKYQETQKARRGEIIKKKLHDNFQYFENKKLSQIKPVPCDPVVLQLQRFLSEISLDQDKETVLTGIQPKKYII